MTITHRSGYSYGTSVQDLKDEVQRYARENAFEVSEFKHHACSCGCQTFRVDSDEKVNVAERICAGCGDAKKIGERASLDISPKMTPNICFCDSSSFNVVSGLSRYPNSTRARWYYIGLLCTSCGMIGVYVDHRVLSGSVHEIESRVEFQSEVTGRPDLELEQDFSELLEMINRKVRRLVPKCRILFEEFPLDCWGLPIDNLAEIAIAGKFRIDGAGKTLEDASWLELVKIANNRLKLTPDTRHKHLEGVRPCGATEALVPEYCFIMGS
jgi:hypothetical protein